MASSPSQGEERECVGSVQLGQTFLLHMHDPLLPRPCPFCLACLFITSLRPSERSLRNSLKHPFRRQRCLRVLLLVLSKRRTNKYGWLVMINGWKHPGSVTSDPQCKTMVYNSGAWVSMFRPCSPSVDHSIQLGRKWRERELKFSGAS